MIIRMVANNANGCLMIISGWNNIPTDTKNNTAKASRRGKVSLAARWLNLEPLSTIPAKNAPKAKEAPKSCTAAKAIPKAMASTERVNSSSEPVLALLAKIQGITREPISNIIAINATTKPTVIATSSRIWLIFVFSDNVELMTAGNSTNTNTMAKSSTTNQPMAILPRLLSVNWRSSSARDSTTVLAVERQRPKTIPVSNDQPIKAANPIPNK